MNEKNNPTTGNFAYEQNHEQQNSNDIFYLDDSEQRYYVEIELEPHESVVALQTTSGPQNYKSVTLHITYSPNQQNSTCLNVCISQIEVVKKVTLTVIKDGTIKRKGDCSTASVRTKDKLSKMNYYPGTGQFSYTHSTNPALNIDIYNRYGISVARFAGESLAMQPIQTIGDTTFVVLNIMGPATGGVVWQDIPLPPNGSVKNMDLTVKKGNEIIRKGACSSGNVRTNK